MDARNTHIVPAILPATEEEFHAGLARATELSNVSRVQIDVVDGKFAKPATWSYEKNTHRAPQLPHLHTIAYEIDLMCFNPEPVIDAWAALGATRFTLHAEALLNVDQTLARILARHTGAIEFEEGGFFALGLALNLDTPLALIEPHLAKVSYVQCMGISRIGRQGEPFNPHVLERLKTLRKKYPALPIQIDGGVSLESAPRLLKAGATDLVVGSKIMRAADPAAAFRAFSAFR
jgi:ribulose-phosphate 3-epimerase